jgi:dienelactone hydrolase
VIHEIPGMTPELIGFAEEVVDSGHTVVLPHLFGTPEAKASLANTAVVFAKLCVNRESTKMALGRPTPVASCRSP